MGDTRGQSGEMLNLGNRVLAAFLAVALVPLVVVAGLSYWRSAQVVERFLAEGVGKTASAYAADLDLFLERQRVRLRKVPDTAVSPSAVLDNAVQMDPNLVALLLLDGTAEVVARGGEPPELWVSDACARLRANPAGAMTHAGAGHAHEVVVGVERGDGLLCGEVSFTLHQDMLSEQANSVMGGTAYIVDRSGTVVCHAFEEDEPHVDRGTALGGVAAQVAAAGLPWAGTTKTTGGEAFAAYAPARDLPWGVWVEVPKEVAAGPLRSGLAWNLGYAGLLALLVTGLAVVVVRRVIAGLDDQVTQRTGELKSAREFSDLLLDTMQQRILVIDDGLKIVRANDAALGAYGAEIQGCGCRMVHQRTGAGDTCPAERVLASGVAESEERVFDHDGRTEILAVDTYPLPGGRAVVEISRDVTDLKRIQAQLVHQEKMAALGTLAAGMAHEIGNPLASMSSELEMLERMWDPEEARASLPVLRDQVRRMSGLLRELVEFGRRPSEGAATFDPAAVLEDVARLLRHDPRARDVAIEVEASPGTEVLCTSRDRLLQVLVNLGINALDAMDGAGSLVFRLAHVGDSVRLEVADSGPGLPEEVARHVFDPFFTTKPPGRGTGLGLFVSERVVESLGGRIELESSPDGATFAVVLPECNCGGTEEASDE